MSLKSISKTRWKIYPDRINIYPYGVSYILTVVMAIIFAGIFVVYVRSTLRPLEGVMPIIAFLLFILLLLWGSAGTYIAFDLNAGIMRKKWMGFIPVTSIPFSQLLGINPVSDMSGSYKYKVFKKDSRYGRGILVSCSYSKNDDPNAIAFVNEVITPIHQQLEAHDGPEDFKPLDIQQYQYFDVQGGNYILKRNKAGSIILGLALLLWGIYELSQATLFDQGQMSIGRICFLLFTLIGGPAIIISGLTSIVLDKNNRQLIRKNPIGLGNKIFPFDEFNGVQTVRKSTNFIYSGTDVRVYFLKPGAKNEEVLTLQSFFRSNKVERFITEFNNIIAS